TPPAAVERHGMLITRDRAGAPQRNPAGPIPFRSVAQDDAARVEVQPTIEHGLAGCAVIGHRVVRAPPRAAPVALGPARAVPFPRVAKDRAEGAAGRVVAPEQNRAAAPAVKRERRVGARHGARGGALGPAAPVPFPGVAHVPAGAGAAEQHGAIAPAVIGHSDVAARRRAGARDLGPGRAVPFPRVAVIAGAAAAEKERPAAARIEDQGGFSARAGSGARTLAPQGAVEFPGVTEQNAAGFGAGAAEENRAGARAVVG